MGVQTWIDSILVYFRPLLHGAARLICNGAFGKQVAETGCLGAHLMAVYENCRSIVIQMVATVSDTRFHNANVSLMKVPPNLASKITDAFQFHRRQASSLPTSQVFPSACPWQPRV